MTSLFSKYSSTVRNVYGWGVELTCSRCKARVKPRYEGWSTHLKTDRGENASIFAKVACPNCGRRMTDEASAKLEELFGGIAIPEQNQHIVSGFIIALIIVPVVLAFFLFVGMQIGWWQWGFGTVWILLTSAVSIPLLVMLRNYRTAKLRMICDCGNPQFVCMGSIDNTLCYRCSSCGRLLRLRV